MLNEIWQPDLTVVFVGTVVDEVSDSIGFHYLHPRNRFWELLEIGGITPQRMITSSERKALAEGHARGNVSDPVRVMFFQKKTSQLLRLGIGISTLNRRTVVNNEKDKNARPNDNDVLELIDKATEANARVLAFVTRADHFVDLFKTRFSDATATLGMQPFRIGNAEVWLLGSPAEMLRGEALTRQEDAFFALGERISTLKKENGK
jgi:G:T/U-mismatch repair DNA glycosylase